MTIQVQQAGTFSANFSRYLLRGIKLICKNNLTNTWRKNSESTVYSSELKHEHFPKHCVQLRSEACTLSKALCTAQIWPTHTFQSTVYSSELKHEHFPKHCVQLRSDTHAHFPKHCVQLRSEAHTLSKALCTAQIWSTHTFQGTLYSSDLKHAHFPKHCVQLRSEARTLSKTLCTAQIWSMHTFQSTCTRHTCVDINLSLLTTWQITKQQ